MNTPIIDLATRRSNALLNQIERSLPPGEPAEQVKAILDMDDPVGFLEKLDAQVFYQLIKSAGWDQTADLIHYATPTQIQNFMDFDCWTRDRLIAEKMDKWLLALVTEADDAKLKKVMRELDAEVVAIYFKSFLHVEEMDEGRIPDHLEGDIGTSPDGVYAIVYPENPDRAALLRVLIDRMFAVDRVLVWTLLEAVRAELMSEMEEYAYKWRNSRLEEFGFVSREEAMGAYSYLDPAKFRAKLERGAPVEERMAHLVPDLIDLPAVLEDEFDDEFFITRALGALSTRTRVSGAQNPDEAQNPDKTQNPDKAQNPDKTQKQEAQQTPQDPQLEDPQILVARVVYQIVSLTNRTMVADGIEPGELESGREVARRTLGYLSLGLEFLSRTDIQRAAEILVDTPIKYIFQVGFSLPRKLQSQLAALEKRPTLTLVDGERYSLLNHDERALAESLDRPRPTFAGDWETYEIFKSQEQLDQAAMRIGMVAFKQIWLFSIAGQTPQSVQEILDHPALENDATSVGFDILFATWLGRFIVTGAADLTPFSAEKLDELIAKITRAPWDEEAGAAYFKPLLAHVEDKLPPGSNTLFTRWTLSTLARLSEEFAGVTSVENPAIFQDILLIDGRVS